MHPHTISTILHGLAAAWRETRVEWTAVPADCRPPRLEILFATQGEVQRMAEAIKALAELLSPTAPAPDPAHAEALAAVLARADEYRGSTALMQPEVLQHLVVSIASDMLVTVERHGPVRVVEPSPDICKHLATIAGMALAGLTNLLRAAAPAEAGEVVNPWGCGPMPIQPREPVRAAACSEGLRPAVIYSEPVEG